MSPNKLVYLLIVIVALGLVACGNGNPVAALRLPIISGLTNPAERLKLNQPAPDFSWTENGASKSLAQLKGQPVILNWWATWCEPCRAELPLLSKFAQDKVNLDKGLIVIGINLKENDSEIQKFTANVPLYFALLRDENALLSLPYNLAGLPQTIFIDRAGNVRAIVRGTLSAEILNEKQNLILL